MTDYVRSQSDGVATFMIIREVRYPGDTAAADQSMWIASQHHSNRDYRPALELVR